MAEDLDRHPRAACGCPITTVTSMVDHQRGCHQTFTCPRCGAKSYNPDDAWHGYCGRCHDWTAQEPSR